MECGRRRCPSTRDSAQFEPAIFAGKVQPDRPTRCIWPRFPEGSQCLPCRLPTPELPRHCTRRHPLQLRRNGARWPAPQVREVPQDRAALQVREDRLRPWHLARLSVPARRALPARRVPLGHPRVLAVQHRLADRRDRAARPGPDRRSAPEGPQRLADRRDLRGPASLQNTPTTRLKRIVRQ